MFVARRCAASSKSRAGGDHGPRGEVAQDMYVGPNPAAPPGQLCGVVPTLQAAHKGLCAAALRLAAAVKYMTHSPLGARTTLGSCEKRGHTSSASRLNSHRASAAARAARVAGAAAGRTHVAWMMCEFVVHALIPQCASISDAHMCSVRLSSPSSTPPPQLLVLRPPSTARSPARGLAAGSTARV